MSNNAPYKNKPLHIRLLESNQIKSKYPNRVPIIIERSSGCASDIPYIDKNKYLIPYDFSFGQFIYVIRKRLSLSPDKAIFLFVNNILPTSSELMIDIYNKHSNIDGFVYIDYTGESVFG
jgi:GABA(A) receptor-associated protein